MAHLVVILGAGASRACTPRPGNEEFRPPLTAELFDPRYEAILRNYPLANTAASDIRVVVSSGALAIERFLRERLRESPDPYARRRYLQIPLYLHELLDAVSRNYTPYPDNFDRLINAALALESVTFVTLNYDVIFDSRLAIQTGPITSMEDYVREEQDWALIKLHGSVDWARAVDGAQITTIDARMVNAFTELGEELEQALGDEIHHRPVSDMQTFRYDSGTPRLFYPALSVPLGSADELVCPPDHVDLLRRRLQSADGLNLLVIGYSGVDQEVLKLLRESGNSIRWLFVINHDVEAGAEAARRITEQFGVQPMDANVSLDEFNAWAQSDRLDGYFDQLT